MYHMILCMHNTILSINMEVFGPSISLEQFGNGDEIGTASPILICAWDLVKHSACCLTKKSKSLISFPFRAG